MKRDIPTRMNGRIPPDVQRFRAIQVTSTIGTGEPGDPYRSAVSIYRENGQHIVTVSDGELLALAGDDARRIVPEQGERLLAAETENKRLRKELAAAANWGQTAPPNPEGSGSPEVKS